jgi:UDP-GlcNAc:undecaprenyl-phosphate GlcNAc-1-phosphate transferase
LFALKVLGLCLAALALAWFGAFYVERRAGRGAPLDVPGSRSSHTRPTARGGGVGFALALCLLLLSFSARQGWPRAEFALFAVAAGLVAAVGLWADFRDPPAHWRLLLELVAAGLVLAAGMGIQQFRLPWGQSVTLWWAAAPLTLLWVVGATNLFNFIDGADGLAAGLAVVYSSGIAAVSFATGHPGEGVVALTVVAGCLGFLRFNFPPARVFMGDVGSLTLGFVFSVLAIRLSMAGRLHVPLVFFLILYSSFLFDTSYTILRRALRGERFWLAHRTHLYERLLLIGWSHPQVTLFYVGLGLVSLALAFGYLRSGAVVKTVIVGCQLLVCAGQLTLVKMLEKSLPGRPSPGGTRERGRGGEG